MIKLPKSKRLRFAVYAFHVFVAVGLWGMYLGTDLSKLAVYMTATAIPIVAYIIGDSLRPSNLNDINK